MFNVFVYGPRDIIPNVPVINTTSHSDTDWQRELSPFFLGPVSLYKNYKANIMENGWQYLKVYSEHVDDNGNPNDNYWKWAKAGWNLSKPVRYPKGKGVKPRYLLWDGERLDYVMGRLKVYFPLYRDAVRTTRAFGILQKLLKYDDVHLWDFDGYNTPLDQALTNPNRSMGHAFVLKAMLLYGPDVTPEIVATERKKEKELAMKHFLDFDY